MTKVLVTGGCGFIGRHVVEELLSGNYELRILDALNEQVHADAQITLPDRKSVV